MSCIFLRLFLFDNLINWSVTVTVTSYGFFDQENFCYCVHTRTKYELSTLYVRVSKSGVHSARCVIFIAARIVAAAHHIQPSTHDASIVYNVMF